MKFFKYLFAFLFLFSVVSFVGGCGASEEDTAANDPGYSDNADEEDDATGDDSMESDDAGGDSEDDTSATPDAGADEATE